MLTAPQSLMTRTFGGSCCPSVREMLVLCITVLLTPGLGPIGAEATVDMSGMFRWWGSFTCISAPSLFGTAAFRRCCNGGCWFWWGCFHCWLGSGLGACCCWASPLVICRRVLTWGPGAGVWAPPFKGTRALDPINGWLNGCDDLGVNCLCCSGCCSCSCCCCGCSGCWCGAGCGVVCDKAGIWPGVWEFSLSSSSFFLTPACIWRRISFLFSISSLRRFCSSIFRRYCRVSSSSSGFCDKVIKNKNMTGCVPKTYKTDPRFNLSIQSSEIFNSIFFSNVMRQSH